MTDVGYPCRPPDVVMSERRIAAAVPTPLSFPRTAMRELVRGRWQVTKLRFDLDAEGRGEVLYQLHGEGWLFHFFLISQKLDEAQKTDRNFAASWDAMGVLCQGEWTPAREAWLRREVPKQRAGLADYDTLMYARGNRSARVFDHVVDSLARGEQPDLRVIAPVGYILRTTAFIGNGQLGTRAFAGLEPGHPLRRPYHAQFCSGFMLREFVFDLVDHIARARNPQAARLAPAWRRYLGLGNSAATGLVAFAANHPHLMHRWTAANEAALAQAVQAAVGPEDARVARYAMLLDKAIRYFEEGSHEPDGVFLPPQAVADALGQARAIVQEFRAVGTVAGEPAQRPFEALCNWARGNLPPEAEELLRVVALEAQPEVADRFGEAFLAREWLSVDPVMTTGTLTEIVDRQYAWALTATSAPGAGHYVWYRSATAPRDVRRGPREGAQPLGQAHETTLDTPLQVRLLREALQHLPDDTPVATLTAARPDLRHIVARVQSSAGLIYADLHLNYLDGDYSPFTSIRYPLTFFGMEKLEAAPPKSVRGVFLQGAPIAEDVATGRDGDWPFPVMPQDPGCDVTLMPLPPAGLGALDRSEAALPIEPTRLRLAPAELARMIQVALQGSGFSLGVAVEAGSLAVQAQCAGEPAVTAVLAHCARSIPPALGARDLREPAPRTHGAAVMRAQGAAALIAASAAADLVLARALAGSGSDPGTAPAAAVALVLEARDAWLCEGLALRMAEHGLLGLVCWHANPDAGPPRSGWTLAWPGEDGAALLRARLAAPAGLHVAVALAPGQARSIAGALGAHDTAAQAWPAGIASLLSQAPDPQAVRTVGDSLLLVAVPAPGMAETSGLITLLGRHGVTTRRHAAAEITRQALERQQRGIEIDIADFHALERAGRMLLVPPEQERRFLPAGFDPLKGF